jgi:carboxymethylenebutenolidase
VVAIGECYHELEEPGSVLAYDAEGTDRGNAHKEAKPIEGFDADNHAIAQHLISRPDCNGPFNIRITFISFISFEVLNILKYKIL